MYSKEESKKLKKEFWTKFGGFSQRKRLSLGLEKKWISHYTGINCLSLKFDFEKNKALVGIEISDGNRIHQEKSYGKLLQLKYILDNTFNEPPEWDTNYQLQDGKTVIKIYHVLDNVNVHNKECWPEVFKFYFDMMIKYESFYTEYKDFILDV